MFRRVPILCFLSFLLILLTGCDNSSTSGFPAIAHDRSTLEWGVVGTSDVPTLDPALASDATSLSVVSLVYGGLVRFDNQLRVQPDGASSWTISRDGLRYTFHLRPGLRFAGGRPVTAGDFAAALDRALGPEGSAGAASFYLSAIAGQTGSGQPRGIQVVNRSTLRITLKRPTAHFVAELAFPVSFVPDASIIARYGPGWTDHAQGFGPYRVLAWQHTRYLTLVRNPHYYGGTPAFKRITLRFDGQSAALAAYQAGKLDLISGVDAGTSLSDPAAGIDRVPALALDYLAFNTTRLPFFRLNARRAFASVWTPSLAGPVMGSSAFPARRFLPSAFGMATQPWRASAAPRVYLRRSRFTPKSFPHVTLVLERDPRLGLLARQLRRLWKRDLGIVVTVQQLDASRFTEILNHRAFDLALVRWGADYPDPQDFLGTQLGSSPDNVSGWTRPMYEHDVFLADTYSPTDPRRADLFRAAATYAAAKVPIVPLDEPAVTAVFRPDVRGLAVTPLGTITGDWRHARFVR
ncbi:MAG TPA: peptide ABC transporter substrate-binding protein [Chloroflexota bacterium]|nr:peptide ABC transporter substrate-binding protein [Chloroflexota bacterium]